MRTIDADAGLPTAVQVCFIVPSFNRPEYLRRCLASIAAQSVSPAVVLAGLRADDEASRAIVAEWETRLPVQAVVANGVGVIGSMSSCLAHAKGEFIALIDDDVELPPEWLEKMLGHLASHPKALAAAGRDLLQDHPEMRREEHRVLDVGSVHWYGRITGNHHRGGGGARFVDVLRGSNCLFRGAFLREAGFEKRLRGKGAQVNWELALAFQAMRRGARLFYDPQVEVIHHVAPRADADVLHRGGYDTEATKDQAFNESFAAAAHAPGWRRFAVLTYQFCAGSPLAPGLAHFLKRALQGDPHLLARTRATVSGRLQAITLAARHTYES